MTLLTDKVLFAFYLCEFSYLTQNMSNYVPTFSCRRFGGESDQQIHLKRSYIFINAMHFKPLTVQPCVWGFLTVQTRTLFFSPTKSLDRENLPEYWNSTSWGSTPACCSGALQKIGASLVVFLIISPVKIYEPTHPLQYLKVHFAQSQRTVRHLRCATRTYLVSNRECRTEAVYSRTEQYMKEPVAPLG